MATPSSVAIIPVLDFSPQDADPDVLAHTRRLLSRVQASQGDAGLKRALHVSADCTNRLKHRVGCVTCRSRLEGLVASLAVAAKAPATAQEAGAQHDSEPSCELALNPCRGGPSPLAAWLVADGGLGLEPSDTALQKVNNLTSFLATFTSKCNEEAGDEASRRGGRASGIVRCPYHARVLGASGRAATVVPSASSKTPVPTAASLTPAQRKKERDRERRRTVALLASGTTEADWETLSSIDVEDTLFDLFAWLAERGRCSRCTDTVTGALLELRRQCLEEDEDLAHPETSTERSAERALASIGASCAASTCNVPECLRVQGKLRHVCGVYRLEPKHFNDRPVYRKECPGLSSRREKQEAYLMFTSLGDWMISGQIDAGGARCEGWAYAMEAAETPEKICATWRVSGVSGWEEDPSMSVTVFEDVAPDFWAGISFEDGSAISKHLACDDQGILFAPLDHADVLEEVIRSPAEVLPVRTHAGQCQHVTTAEAAQRELYGWLLWLFRERLEKQRQHILAQAQVSHQLCRLYACAAMQQLEQAAEQSPPVDKAKEKKRAGKKKTQEASQADIDADIAEAIHTNVTASLTVDVDAPNNAKGEDANGVGLLQASVIDHVDGESNASASTYAALVSPVSGCHATDSDGSASTRASSEEPPEVHRGLATKSRILMQEMGWESEPAGKDALGDAEIAAWFDRHPGYEQAVRERRQRLQDQFQAWASAKSS